MPFFRQGQYIGSIAQQRATGNAGNKLVGRSDKSQEIAKNTLAKISSGQLSRKSGSSDPFKKPVSRTVQSTPRRPDTSAVLKSRIIR